MASSSRLDAASCAICMDSLFNLKDDLDEVMPIATPDCGHVFHEKCLLDWFKTQAQHYLATVQDRDLTENDAPAECPQCRTECFADPETGQPSIHRLFINFENASNPPSSQPSSSPARWNTPDKHLMGLSRRAKGLASELGAMSPESREEDVAGTIGRVKTFRKDMISVKATSAFKVRRRCDGADWLQYIGGLTVALNRLSDQLEEHPLIPVLRGQLQASQRDHATLCADFPVAVSTAVREAVQAEKAKADRVIRKAEKDRELMQRELEKEQVARVAAKRAASERESAQEGRIRDLERLLQREKEDRIAMSNLVNERTLLLKRYQSKAESRKDLKRTVEEQQQTIERLNASLAAREGEKASGQSGASGESQRQVDAELEEAEDFVDLDMDMHAADLTGDAGADADLSVQELPPQDDSLFIDMEEEAPRAGRSTTARSYVFDYDGPVKKQPLSRTASSISSSKYFPDKEKEKEKSSRVLVAASSPAAPSPKRNRSVVDITDLTESSPESLRSALLTSPLSRSRPPLGARDDNKRSYLPPSSSRSMLDFLGIQEKKGKQKGLAMGAKVRRRA